MGGRLGVVFGAVFGWRCRLSWVGCFGGGGREGRRVLVARLVPLWRRTRLMSSNGVNRIRVKREGLSCGRVRVLF